MAAGLSGRGVRQLVMAVDETMANAIEHGMDRRSPGELAIHATMASKTLTIAVRHRGPRFDPTIEPTLTPAESVRQRAAHGYGLPLIRTLVDDVEYKFVRGMNELRLSVRRPPAE